MLCNNLVIESKIVKGRTDRGKRGAQGPATRQRRITRARVLETAEQLFVEHGFRGTSVQDIAAAAGYTTGAIYSNFAGKDGLFLAVAQQRSDRVLGEVRRRALELIEGSADAAGALTTALTQLMPEPGWVAVYYEFLSYAVREPELLEAIAGTYRSLTVVVREVLESMDSPPLPLDRLAPLVAAQIEGSVLLSFVDPSRSASELTTDGLARLVAAPPVA